MATGNYIKNVAIVGAGGNSGRFMTEALLKTGKHTVTAITRVDSQSKLSEGVDIKKVDYSKPETIVEALRGQDALVITLSGYALQHEKILVEAAAEAGVAWILPNEWGPDTANEGLVRDVAAFKSKPAIRKVIADLDKISYISICTGYWYEYSLAVPVSFGIDFINRTATLFDEGETKISVSTWPQVGRVVAALLSLPINSSTSTTTPSLSSFANKIIYVSSFTISQKDMLASTIRITKTKESDWTITKEPVKERYAAGLKEVQEGKMIGFAKMGKARVFFPDGCGDFENGEGKGTVNEALGLPKEDLDEATGRAMERAMANRV